MGFAHRRHTWRRVGASPERATPAASAASSPLPCCWNCWSSSRGLVEERQTRGMALPKSCRDGVGGGVGVGGHGHWRCSQVCSRRSAARRWRCQARRGLSTQQAGRAVLLACRLSTSSPPASSRVPTTRSRRCRPWDTKRTMLPRSTEGGSAPAGGTDPAESQHGGPTLGATVVRLRLAAAACGGAGVLAAQGTRSGEELRSVQPSAPLHTMACHAPASPSSTASTALSLDTWRRVASTRRTFCLVRAAGEPSWPAGAAAGSVAALTDSPGRSTDSDRRFRVIPRLGIHKCYFNHWALAAKQPAHLAERGRETRRWRGRRRQARRQSAEGWRRLCSGRHCLHYIVAKPPAVLLRLLAALRYRWGLGTCELLLARSSYSSWRSQRQMDSIIVPKGRLIAMHAVADAARSGSAGCRCRQCRPSTLTFQAISPCKAS